MWELGELDDSPSELTAPSAAFKAVKPPADFAKVKYVYVQTSKMQ